MAGDEHMQVESLVVLGIAALVVLVAALLLMAGRRRGGSTGQVELVESINRRLEQLEQLSRGVEDLSKLFLVPHARGGLGESLLEELLRTWLPQRAYETQYTFKNGTRVDAIVRISPYIIPIDAKFPLESFRRTMSNGANEGVPTEVRQAFRKHVDDIARKYIQPNEGTMQFALMYIPSERVYYEVFAASDGALTEEALRKGVVPVSPSTMFTYLQTVAYGLRGLIVPEERREMMRLIEQLRSDFVRFTRAYELAGTHLRNFERAFDDAGGHLSRLTPIVDRLADRSSLSSVRQDPPADESSAPDSGTPPP